MNELEVTRNNTARRLIRNWVSGKKEGTLRSYRADLSSFSEYVGMSDAEAVAQLLVDKISTYETLSAYRDGLIEKKLAPNTINRKLAAIRSILSIAR